MDKCLLESILTAENPSALIRKNEQYVFTLIPPLAACKGFNHNNPWHVFDVYEHTLKVLDGVPCDLVLRYAALFHDTGKPFSYIEDEKGVGHFYGHWEKSCKFFEDFAEKYGPDADLKSRISRLIFYHDINFARLSDSEIRRFSAEEIKLIFAHKRADLLAQNPKYHILLSDYDLLEARSLEIVEK